MRLHLQNYVQLASRTPVSAGVALLGRADARAVFDARRNVDVDCSLLHHAGFALALAARIRDHPAQTLAGGTGAGNTEHGLLIAYLAAPGAGLARSRPFTGGCSAPMTLLADLITADLDFSLLAEGGFFKGQGDIGAGIAASLGASAPSPADVDVHTEEVAEDVAENIAEVGKVRRVEALEASAAVHTGVAELVIARALFSVHKDAIRLSALLELLFRLGIAGIAVRMVLHGQLAIGALDLLLGGRAGYAQDFVVITFCLRCQISLNKSDRPRNVQ